MSCAGLGEVGGCVCGCVCGYGGGEDVALAAGQTGRGYNQGAAGWLAGRRLPPHGEHQPKLGFII